MPSGKSPDNRFIRKEWDDKKVQRDEGQASLKIGKTEFVASRKITPMANGGISVFKTALEGLDELRSDIRDGDLIAAAISVAESPYGYATSEDRENIILIGSAKKEYPVSGNSSKGLKLLMSWLQKEGLLEEDRVREDKIYKEADGEAANNAPFLAGQSQNKKNNWIKSYNSERAAAFETLDHMFVRT